MSDNKKKDIYEIIKENRIEVLNDIVESIEKDPKYWIKGWDTSMVAAFNPTTNNYYSGGNILKAALGCKKMESKDPRWLTFNQIKDNNLKLQKGAKSIQLEYWTFNKDPLTTDKIKGLSDKELTRIENKIASRMAKGYKFTDFSGKEITHRITRNDPNFNDIAKKVENTPLPSYFNVFNAGQIDGIEKFEYPKLEDSKLWEIADDLISSCPVPIKEIAQFEAYNENKNGNTKHIILPPRETFKNSNEYLATLLHEMGHNTGQKDDLDRIKGDKFGDLKYAREELVAEFTSIIVQSRLGIELTQSSKDNHTAYIQSWAKQIKNKETENNYKPENELYRALSEATKGADLIMERYKTKMIENGKEYIDIKELSTFENKEIKKEKKGWGSKSKGWGRKSNEEKER